MKWKQFLKLAYPDDLQKEDMEKRTFIFRWHRWIGLYLGYPIFHLKISANFVGISRIFIALLSLYFISFAKQGTILMPFIGIFTLYSQHILDNVDGVIARVAGTVNKLGAQLDGIANAFSRHAILILIATFTDNIIFIILAIFTSYFCVTLRHLLIVDKLAYDNQFKGYAIFFRVVFSIQAMLLILPTLIVLNNTLNWPIKIFSYITISFYATITVIWFLLSFYNFYKNKP